MCSVLRGTGPTTPGAQRRGIDNKFGLLGTGSMVRGALDSYDFRIP